MQTSMVYERHSIFNLIELLIVNQMTSYCNVIEVVVVVIVEQRRCSQF